MNIKADGQKNENGQIKSSTNHDSKFQTENKFDAKAQEAKKQIKINAEPKPQFENKYPTNQAQQKDKD